MENNEHPTIITFYLERDMMTNREAIQPFVDSVNNALAVKKANAMAFFLPTDKSPRVECINPVQVKDADMEKIYQMVEDIKKNFDIEQGADEGKDNPDNLIDIHDEGEGQ